MSNLPHIFTFLANRQTKTLTGIWGRATWPLALALSCISFRCCFRYLYGGIPSLEHVQKKQENIKHANFTLLSKRGLNAFRWIKGVNEVDIKCLHTAVGQGHCICVAWHALLLTVVGAGYWGPGVAHVSVVWVYRLSPRSEGRREQKSGCWH